MWCFPTHRGGIKERKKTMSKNTKETKICKHCKSEIPAGAKICPQCRKKQGGKLKWIIIVILALAVIGAVAGGGNSDDSGAKKSDNGTAEEPTIEYTACTVNEMMQALEENAMSASEKYKNQYLEVTGRLDVIDSDGKYISLYPDDEFAITGVQCYIKNDEQKSIISGMTKGDTVTLRGKCTNVGEVLGYTLDIDSINQ